MPWESTWFIFSCNPLVHSSLSNRNTFCRNDKSLTNEFRRSVAHIIRLKDPQKSPKKNHLFPGSTNMINCKSDCCNSSVMIIWQKYPLTLEPWWVDPLTKHLSSFHLHHLHHKHMALSLSQLRHAFLDTSRWNLQSRDPHWSLPNQSGSYGFQWRSGWLWRRILQQHIFCFLLFRDPPIWPNQFYCEWSKKKNYPEGNIKRPLGTVSPWAMEVSRYRQKQPMLNYSFFVRLHSFPSTQFPVLSCPHLSASAVRVHLDGVKMGQTGGHYLIIKTSHSWRRYHWIEMINIQDIMYIVLTWAKNGSVCIVHQENRHRIS